MLKLRFEGGSGGIRVGEELLGEMGQLDRGAQAEASMLGKHCGVWWGRANGKKLERNSRTSKS